jgi:hypothetical protein
LVDGRLANLPLVSSFQSANEKTDRAAKKERPHTGSFLSYIHLRKRSEALEAINKNMNEKLEAIRRKCIEANPEIEIIDSRIGLRQIIGRPIRLADVLLAINNPNAVGLLTGVSGVNDDYSGNLEYEDEPLWNLRADDLNSQSEETIEFLVGLLN